MYPRDSCWLAQNAQQLQVLFQMNIVFNCRMGQMIKIFKKVWNQRLNIYKLKPILICVIENDIDLKKKWIQKLVLVGCVLHHKCYNLIQLSDWVQLLLYIPGNQSIFFRILHFCRLTQFLSAQLALVLLVSIT